MAQYNITLEEGLVRNLLMGNSVDEVLKQIMEQLLNQLLEAKATDICGAGLYEQNEGRSAYRNGYRDRSLVTRFGKIELLVPRVRDHSALTEGFIEKYKKINPGREIALCCYEDVNKPGYWCHRRFFAEWWRGKTGEIIDELPDPSHARKDAHEQMSIFDS